MKSITGAFPARLRNQPGFAELRSVIESIYRHRSLCLKNNSLDKMIEASLLFTVCFYANATALLQHVVNELKPGIEPDTARLRRVIALVSGELTDNVASSEDAQKRYGPHYVLMLKAAQAAGIDTSRVERYVLHRNLNHSVEHACNEAKFSVAVTDYLVYSNQCCSTRLGSLATIAGRELILSLTFQVILGHLPKDDRLDLVRKFYELHVFLDKEIKEQDSHGKLMTDELNSLTDTELGEVVAVMTRFFARRLAVYNLCLAPEANL